MQLKLNVCKNGKKIDIAMWRREDIDVPLDLHGNLKADCEQDWLCYAAEIGAEHGLRIGYRPIDVVPLSLPDQRLSPEEKRGHAWTPLNSQFEGKMASCSCFRRSLSSKAAC